MIEHSTISSLVRDWESAKSYLYPAVERSGTHYMSDVFDRLLTGAYQLWRGNNCALVTEIIDYPRKRCLLFAFAGGDGKEILDMSEEIIEWGKVLGCNMAKVAGRRGWERKVNWNKKDTVLTREL